MYLQSVSSQSCGLKVLFIMSFQSPYCRCYGLTDSPESVDSISHSKGIVSQAKTQRTFCEQTRFPVESWFAMIVLTRSPLCPIGVLALNQRTVDSDYERCYAWHNSDVDLLTDAAAHSSTPPAESGALANGICLVWEPTAARLLQIAEVQT